MRNTSRSPAFITPLNALRFFAAVAIVVFHFGRWSFPFSIPILQPYALISNTGITLFFVLSGFIMVYVYGEKLRTLHFSSSLAFYRARIARIVPIYFIALLLMIWSLINAGESISPHSLLLQGLFLQAWIPNEALKLNFPGWTLSVEMMFYAIFPFLFLAFHRIGRLRSAIITSLLWLIGNAVTIFFVITYVNDPMFADAFLKFFPPLHLSSFLIGMLAGMWYRKSKKKISLWLVLTSLAFLLVFPFVVPRELFSTSHNGLFAPMFAILILAIAQTKGRLSRYLSTRPMVVGGDISYGIYILQAPVYAWVYYVYNALGISVALDEEGRFFLYLILLCVAAWISHVTIERWAKRLIRSSESRALTLPSN
jgi:peptidoglycan/LPS O-acetylase OafA/YrhL